MKKLVLSLMLLVALVSARAQSHSASLSWTASPDATANPTGNYNIYRATGNCADTTIVFAKVGTALSTATTFTDSTVAAATSYCFEVTFFANGLESIDSNLAQAVIPQNPTAPRPPTTLFVTSVK